MKRIKPNGEMGIVPMLTRFCHRYPKACAIVGSAVLFVLLILYLLAFFTPGVILYSYGETVFLVRQSDGTFEGRNQYAAYRLEKTAGDEETTIRFFVADTPKEYRVISREDGAHVEIYEDGSLAFEGIAHQSGDSFFLQTESGTLEDGTWKHRNHRVRRPTGPGRPVSFPDNRLPLGCVRQHANPRILARAAWSRRLHRFSRAGYRLSGSVLPLAARSVCGRRRTK